MTDTKTSFFETLRQIAEEQNIADQKETDRVLGIVKNRAQQEREDIELFARMVNNQNHAAVPAPVVEAPVIKSNKDKQVELFKCIICAVAMVGGAIFGGLGYEGIGFGLCAAGMVVGLSAGVGEDEGRH